MVGYAPGKSPSFYHTWYLAPDSTGCHVVTEEVGKGADARRFRRMDESTLHRGHELWLAGLKRASENPVTITGLRQAPEARPAHGRVTALMNRTGHSAEA